MTQVIDRALSVHAPWAWALMFGGKDVENRSTNFPRLPVGTRVWIHASLWPGGEIGSRFTTGRRGLLWDIDLSTLGKCVELTVSDIDVMWEMRGHIVGSVEVHGYATPDSPPDSVWYVPGSLGILVRDPRPLATPVPAKGALGWWSVSKREGLAEQLKEAA